MIERIYIPTVNRVNNQITYNNLSQDLKKRVTMVVQSWERPKYNYDCEYLVLPDTNEYHYSNYFCLAKTRKFIYEIAKNTKYSILDDDLIFYRRNKKYFQLSSNMEKSKRKCLPEDLDDMFDEFDKLLNETDITVIGCNNVNLPPSAHQYEKNCFVFSAYWINGNDFQNQLQNFDLTSVKIGEDLCFVLNLLTNGFGNRRSNEFCFDNQSVNKKDMSSTIWDKQKIEDSIKDQLYIQKLFNDVIKLPKNFGEGDGFRGHPRLIVKFKLAYKLGLLKKYK